MEVDRALQPVAVWTQDSSSGLTRAPGYSTLVFAGRLHRSQTRYWASWSHLSKRDATLWGWKASSPIGTTCIWGYGVCWFSLLYFFYPSKVRHLLGTFFFFLCSCPRSLSLSKFQPPSCWFPVSSDSYPPQNAGICLFLRFSVEEEVHAVSFRPPWISFFLCVFFGSPNRGLTGPKLWWDCHVGQADWSWAISYSTPGKHCFPTP